MIYCPSCGTSNRQGSRFCNECGATLPQQTGLRCPMCGTMNPVGNVYCDQCNARLIPLSAEQPPEEDRGGERPPIKGLSLPTIPLEETQPPAETEETDWLTELRSTAGGAEDLPTPPAGEIEAAEIPDWLTGAEATPSVEETPAAPTEEPAKAEQAPPDWLKELESAPPAPQEPPAAPAAEQAPPDWLRELESAPPAPQEPPAAPAAEQAPPDWLKELESAPAALQEPPAAPVAEQAPPDWLKELESVSAPPASEPAETPPAPVFTSEEELTLDEDQTLPDWLAELDRPPSPPERKTPAPSAPAATQVELPTAPLEDAGLVPAEIPEWLKALRPSTEPVGPSTDEPPEADGLLEGLGGTLVPSDAVAMPTGTQRPTRMSSTAAAVARAELLQELLGRPAATLQPTKKKRERNTAWTLQRLAVGLLLILATVAPMAVELPFLDSSVTPMDGHPAVALFTAIEQGIEAGDPVLVAFEYSPAEADEMNWVAEPILRHLIERGGHLVIVSTKPEGPSIAKRVLEELLPDTEERSLHATNLGYQPGQAVGVQEWLSNLDNRATFGRAPAAQAAALEGVHTAADVAKIVVLAAQPDDLRIWVEQTSSEYHDVPMAAGVSARVEPLANTYLPTSGGAGRLEGMVVGLAGATVYEAQLGVGGQAAFYLQSLGMTQLTVAALMLAGAFIFLIGGRRQ